MGLPVGLLPCPHVSFHLWAPPVCPWLASDPLGCHVFMAFVLPGCLLAQMLCVAGAHPSASPACLLLGHDLLHILATQAVSVLSLQQHVESQTSQSLTSQQSCPLLHRKCPLRPQLFSLFSGSPCVSRQICLLSSKDALLLCFRTPALERFSPRTAFLSSLSHLSLPFYDLFKIHLFQKRKMKGNWRLEVL